MWKNLLSLQDAHRCKKYNIAKKKPRLSYTAYTSVAILEGISLRIPEGIPGRIWPSLKKFKEEFLKTLHGEISGRIWTGIKPIGIVGGILGGIHLKSFLKILPNTKE